MLSALAFTAALAYAGVKPAALVVWVVLAVLVVVWLLSLLADT